MDNTSLFREYRYKYISTTQFLWNKYETDLCGISQVIHVGCYVRPFPLFRYCFLLDIIKHSEGKSQPSKSYISQ